MTSSSLGHLGEEGLDFGFELFDFGVDFGEWAGWGVGVEVAGEWDFVADFGFSVVDPGVGYIGQYFVGEVGVDGGAVVGGGEAVGGVGFVHDMCCR